MGKPIWTLRPEQWLEKDIDDYMKKHPKLDRSKALHQYIIDLKQQKEESAKKNKRLREEARHYHKKAQKAEKQAANALQKRKADSTSKPQQEEQWKVTDEWINKWLPLMSSGRESLDPFHCPYEEKLCYRLQRQQCRKKAPSKFKQCQEWQIYLFNLSRAELTTIS
jgi:hypothetical protein